MLSCCAAAGQHSQRGGGAARDDGDARRRGRHAQLRHSATAISACAHNGAWQEAVALLNAFEAASMYVRRCMYYVYKRSK